MKLRDVLRSDLVAAAAPTHIGASLRGWFFSPQLNAVWLVRLTQYFYKRRWGRILSKMCELRVIHRYACFISSKSTVGMGFSLPHPTGIVIGIGVTLGNNITIYQGVTLGVKSRRSTTYPFIEDGVVIYSGAVVVGGVRVGQGSVIGANSVVLADVPAGAVIPAGSVFK